MSKKKATYTAAQAVDYLLDLGAAKVELNLHARTLRAGNEPRWTEADHDTYRERYRELESALYKAEQRATDAAAFIRGLS